MLLQSLLVQGMPKNVKINKPMLTNRQKVLSALIRSSGVVVNVRNMVKNMQYYNQMVKGYFLKHMIYITFISNIEHWKFNCR